VLHSHRKRGRFLDTLEEFEIYKAGKKHPQHILNEKSSFESDILYEAALDIEKVVLSRNNAADNNDVRGERGRGGHGDGQSRPTSRTLQPRR
jgi:hypothetical protein